MNVLFISPNSPEISVGGIERYIKNLINFCQKKEGRFDFLLPSNGKETSERKNNVTIYRKDFLSLSYKKRKSTGAKRTSQKEIQKKSRGFFDFLLSLFEEQEIDIVSAQNFHLGLPPSYNLMLNMACFSNKIPLILRVHSFATKTIHEEIINQLLWDKIICVSKSVTGDCFQKGADINKLTTKYLGVNTREFKSGLDKNWLKRELALSKKDRIILCASRTLLGFKEILKEKGILNLIEAFSKLTPRYENIRLVIAVAMPPKRLMKEFSDSLEKLKGFIRLHNVKEKVIYRTFKLEQMPLVYAGSNVFVLPSENETLGQVYIEAMACGVPVIGTKAGGVPEIISHEYNGFLIQPNDASILTQKIEELLKNQKLRRIFIKRGLKIVETKFSTEKQLNKLFNYFGSLIEEEG